MGKLGINKSNGIKKLLQFAIVSGLIATTVGCGNAKTMSGSSIDSLSQDEAPNMDEVHSKLDTMEVEVFNVNQEMAALDLQNPLNLLGDGLKDSVKKLTGVLTDLKGKVDELKAKINAQIAKLDANDPKQQKLIAKLQEALKYLDEVSAHIDEVVAKVEAKIDALFAKIEKKIEDKLSGIQEVLAKLALDKLRDSILKQLIGG